MDALCVLLNSQSSPDLNIFLRAGIELKNSNEEFLDVFNARASYGIWKDRSGMQRIYTWAYVGAILIDVHCPMDFSDYPVDDNM